MKLQRSLSKSLTKSLSRKQLAHLGYKEVNYEEVDDVIPSNYKPILDNRDTQVAVNQLKRYVEDELNKALNLLTVQCPLVVEECSGSNDLHDQDCTKTPISFKAGLGLKAPIKAQVVQTITKWKRFALKQYGCEIGEGINTDLRAIRKDRFLDHDHSCYVDQWDWEIRINEKMRNLEYLEKLVTDIWDVIKGAEKMIHEKFPALHNSAYQCLPEKVTFIHAEDLLRQYPGKTKVEREIAALKEYGAVFVKGIGFDLEHGIPHDLRASDYDDWIASTEDEYKLYHGLNGNLLAYNPVTDGRIELCSIGIRVNSESLKQQLKRTNKLHWLKFKYHNAVANDLIPLSVGGSIGQSTMHLLMLHKAMLGEVQVSAWPEELKDLAKNKGIELLQ